VSTNRGEPLVLQKKLSLSGIAYENAARRLIGKQDYFVELNSPNKVGAAWGGRQRGGEGGTLPGDP
jgi:septum formation inhibitor-activating ATPase MinD